MFHLHFFIDKGFLVISHETAADAKKGVDWLMLCKLASGVAGPRDASDVGRALSLSGDQLCSPNPSDHWLHPQTGKRRVY